MWLLPAVFAAYFAVAAAQLHAPFTWDEVNFFWNAEAIAQHGVPYANAGFLGDRGAIGAQYQFGLWHPPLYLYTLGLGIKLFGASEATARGVGVVVMALTALGVYALARLTIPAPARDWGALVAVALFLASPLVVQSALVLDIDGTVLTLLMVVWALAYLRLEDTHGRRLVAALGALSGLFALALWAKLTTPWFWLGVILVYQTLRGQPLRGLAHAAAIGVFGGLLFWGSWDLACRQLGLPFEMPFQVTWLELRDALGDGHTRELAERLESQTLPIVAWVSPYLVAVYVAAAVARVVALMRQRRVEPVDLLLGFGTVVAVVYFVKLAAGFPKYHIAMMPFWAVVVAHWLAVSWVRLPRPAVPALLLLVGEAVVAAAWFAHTFVADTWLMFPRTIEAPEGLGVALLLGGGLVLGALVRAAAFVAPLAALTLALYVGWGAATSWYHTQVSYSTNYWYGSTGQRQMAAAVNDLLRRYQIAGPYIGAKEVVVYTDNHFFLDQDTVYWLWSEQGERFDGRLLGFDIPLVVAWVRDPWVRHVFMEQLAGTYVPMVEIGDYLAFVKRSLVSGPAEPPSEEMAAEARDEPLVEEGPPSATTAQDARPAGAAGGPSAWSGPGAATAAMRGGP